MKRKIVTFGELMLRLKSPGYERLFQSPLLEATFGGSEANTAVSLSQFGCQTFFVTAVPDNIVGHAAVRALQSYGVDVSNCVFQNGRLGVYFLESGACQRPSIVTYDRENSCIANAAPADFNWSKIFADAGWFHVSGITAAISQTAADCVLTALQHAKSAGITTSLDLNYRKKLWKYGKSAEDVISRLIPFVDVVIGNEEDIQLSFGIQLSDDAEQTAAYHQLAQKVMEHFENVQFVAISMRTSLSANNNRLSALLETKNGGYDSPVYKIEDIVDRVGAGDAFAAGLIFGVQQYGCDMQSALDYAVAASCLKHSIPGDFNRVTREEVNALVKGNRSGRVQR